MRGRREEGVNSIRGGGWSKSGQLFTTDQNTFLTCQANFPEAYSYTVQFGLIPPTTSPTNNNFCMTFADILWSVQGNTITRTVQVGQGVSVTGVGEAVKIKVYDTTLLAAPGFAEVNPYQVNLSIARGVRASTRNPPTLWAMNRVQLNALSSVALEVPKNNGITSVEVLSANTDGTQSLKTNVFHFNVEQQLKTYNLLDVEGFVDIAPGTDQIEVENADAAKAAYVSIVWGIDG